MRLFAGSATSPATASSTSTARREEIVTALTEKLGIVRPVARAGSVVIDGERGAFDQALAGDEEGRPPAPVSGGARRSRFRKPERVLMIVNPVRAPSRVRSLEVLEKALSADFKLDIHETTGRHATELARDAVADLFDLVVVFSGDGTINETLNALVGTGRGTRVIPGGATNVLARWLGFPLDPWRPRRTSARGQRGSRRRPNLGKATTGTSVSRVESGWTPPPWPRRREEAESKKEFEWRSLVSVFGKDSGTRTPERSRVWIDAAAIDASPS